MKNNKKRIIKIISGVVAILLIIGILSIANEFIGNPIEAKKANKEIEKYVSENFKELNLEIEKPKYNFKDGGYNSKVQSKTSLDTNFSIYYRNGKIQGDDYQWRVLFKLNTLDRLAMEYSKVVKNIIDEKLGYKDSSIRVMYDKSEYERNNDVLELDMKFEKTLPLKAEVTITIDLNDVSIENIAKTLKESHDVFIKNECTFSKYNLYVGNENTSITIHDITPEDIEGDDLKDKLERAKNGDSENGIYMHIKNK